MIESLRSYGVLSRAFSSYFQQNLAEKDCSSDLRTTLSPLEYLTLQRAICYMTTAEWTHYPAR